MTSRFNDHCLDYLPVDLNSLLYKYETDLAEIFTVLGDRRSRRNIWRRHKKEKDDQGTDVER